MDEQLLKNINFKDEKSYEILIETYNRFLWAIVGGILQNVGTSEDIEECISDVFVKLWENPRAYNPKKGNLKSFLGVMARNKALDKYRQLSKVKVEELKEVMCSNEDDLMDYIINKERYRKLYEEIYKLKEPDKEIMIRRYFYDEKPLCIANKISIPVKEVENKLYQNKLKLKKIFCI